MVAPTARAVDLGLSKPHARASVRGPSRDARSLAGGYTPVLLSTLDRFAEACRGPLAGDATAMRAWCARQEAAHRATEDARSDDADEPARDLLEDARKLMGRSRRPVVLAAMKRLDEAGVAPAESPRPVASPGDRVVPVPRRPLRWLAGEGNAATVATYLQACMKGAYLYEGRSLRMGGVLRAGLAARTWGLSKRSLIDGRALLARAGVLVPVDLGRRSQTAYGWAFQHPFEWDPEQAADARRGCSLLHHPPAVCFTTPLQCASPLTSTLSQEPLNKHPAAEPDQVRASRQVGGEEARGSGRRVAQDRRPGRFERVTYQDLRDPTALAGLWDAACSDGTVPAGSRTDAGQVTFFALAARAMRKGSNAAAYFASLVRSWAIDGISGDDEAEGARILAQADGTHAPADELDVVSDLLDATRVPPSRSDAPPEPLPAPTARDDDHAHPGGRPGDAERDRAAQRARERAAREEARVLGDARRSHGDAEAIRRVRAARDRGEAPDPTDAVVAAFAHRRANGPRAEVRVPQTFAGVA